jgi:hypothetical protein
MSPAKAGAEKLSTFWMRASSSLATHLVDRSQGPQLVIR